MPSLHKIPILLVLSLASCDETSGGVQQDYMNRHRDSFVFHVDRAHVVAGVRGVIADKGLELIEPTSDDTIHTTHGRGGYETTDEYTIHLIPSKAGYLVHIVLQSRDKDQKILSSLRETDMEWELAQRLEPDRALEITDAANKRADKVAPRAHIAPAP
jgi:hypothetical protein